MKKFFENKWVESVLKVILTIMVSAVLYNQVEIRDNNKYVQPAIDERQNENIKALKENCKVMYETVEYKTANTHQRIDKLSDKDNEMDRKLDLILYELKIYNKKDLITEK